MQALSLLGISSFKKSLLIMPLVALLSACGSDNDDIKVDPNTKMIYVNFNEGITGWKSGFADYPVGEEKFYELAAGQSVLPEGLENNRKGFKVSGNNHSDDLYMFITKKFDGLEPNTIYYFQFKTTFATNAQKGCMGVGGAPGESVTIKAGASKTEPLAVNNGAGTYLMNIDKGNQVNGGSDAIAIGDFANSRECGDANTGYMKKVLISEKHSFSAPTNEEGSIWILLSTDSGFEATTTIYFMEAEVAATKR
jgi:hypothetical protein